MTAPVAVDLPTYLRWRAEDPVARRAFLEPRAECLGGRTRESFADWAWASGSESADRPRSEAKEFRIGDGAGGTASIVVLTETVVTAEADLMPEADLLIEVFRHDGDGLELLGLERVAHVPRSIDPAGVKLVPVSGRWLFLTVFAQSGGMGTGMSGARTDWFQVSTEGISPVWSEAHRSIGANTAVGVAAGVLGVEVAELDSRPAVFADTWKALRPTGMYPDTTVEDAYHRGMAVWRSPADHARFVIDERFSGLSADQAAAAWETPSAAREHLFGDKRPEAVAEAADWLGLDPALGNSLPDRALD